MSRMRTTFEVPKMDCASEENLVRMALADVSGVEHLTFDLKVRRVAIDHGGDERVLLDRLEPLDLGARIVGSEMVGPASSQATSGTDERRVLKLLLLINGVMFVVEGLAGWVARSTGLLADSLDMLADAGVYGMSLYAVGKAISVQRRAARTSGVLQLLLAMWVAFEVVRRWMGGGEPSSSLMIGISALALLANLSCMALLHKHRDGSVHMQASWIFTSSDVLANAGVLVAGALVYWLDSPVPDFVIGAVIVVMVLRGAVRILKLSRAPTVRVEP